MDGSLGQMGAVELQIVRSADFSVEAGIHMPISVPSSLEIDTDRERYL